MLVHASGANITVLSILKRGKTGSHTFSDVAILMSAPLHLGYHFLYENRRGVDTISEMSLAADGYCYIYNCDRVSPTVLTELWKTYLA